MTMPGFWHRDGSAVLALLLRPFGWFYGMLTLRRMRRPGWRAPLPVISVGNFTAGGAGKTPAALAIAEALIARGERPFFLTRGYGGREKGPLAVDLARHTAAEVGDEPLLLARLAPCIVARDRAAGAAQAIAAGASCLILDDALQNPALEKDFSLAVIDGGFGFGNGECVPAGPLRAPVAATLAHVHAVLVIGEDETGTRQTILPETPVFSGQLRPDAKAKAELRGARVIAFSGIGRPEKFEATVRELGAGIIATRRFADHHPFSDNEALALLALSETTGAMLVTTEKDQVRLQASATLRRLSARAIVVPVTLCVEAGLFEAIYRAVDSSRKRSRMASGPE